MVNSHVNTRRFWALLWYKGFWEDGRLISVPLVFNFYSNCWWGLLLRPFSAYKVGVVQRCNWQILLVDRCERPAANTDDTDMHNGCVSLARRLTSIDDDRKGDCGCGCGSCARSPLQRLVIIVIIVIVVVIAFGCFANRCTTDWRPSRRWSRKSVVSSRFVLITASWRNVEAVGRRPPRLSTAPADPFLLLGYCLPVYRRW